MNTSSPQRVRALRLDATITLAMVFRADRKNRKAGTKARGRGQDNRLVIPSRWRDSQVYWEKLTDYRTFALQIAGRQLPFVVERPHPRCYHAVTPEDVATLLAALPIETWEALDLFVFRQPTKKQRILSCCWARLAYFAEVADFEGITIFLEALPRRRTWYRSKSLTPDAERELRRLEALGVELIPERRRLRLTSSPEADRQVQLYHSVLHELGHLEDWIKHDRYVLEDPEDRAAEGERRIDEGTPHYDQKSARELEVYAHRFSDRHRAALIEAGVIPFTRRFDETLMASVDVDEAWFSADGDGGVGEDP